MEHAFLEGQQVLGAERGRPSAGSLREPGDCVAFARPVVSDCEIVFCSRKIARSGNRYASGNDLEPSEERKGEEFLFDDANSGSDQMSEHPGCESNDHEIEG